MARRNAMHPVVHPAKGAPTRIEREGGLTVVELLIAASVFLIVLALTSGLFIWQSRLNSYATARSSVQNQVRLTMQLLGSELSLVGQTVGFTDGGRVSTVGFEACPQIDAGGTLGLTLTCLELTDEATGPIVRFAYTDSLESAGVDSCRIASYRINSETLQRANEPCFDDATDTEVSFDFTEDEYVDLVDEVIAFDIELVCSDGTRLDVYPVYAGTRCNPDGAYPRSVRFAVLARSGMSATAPGNYEMRPPWWEATDPERLGRICEGREVCFGLSQEFAMPNMNKEK